MARNQKRGSNRTQKSQGSEKYTDQEIANRPPNPNNAQGTRPEDVLKWHEYMLELEKRVKAAFGEDGLRRLSGLEVNIEKVMLAHV